MAWEARSDTVDSQAPKIRRRIENPEASAISLTQRIRAGQCFLGR